jgi:putative RNA 2'-phosphotransferase
MGSKRVDISLVKVSKFLSLILRHKPEEIGLVLDENGWAEVEELIRLAGQGGRRLSRSLIEQVVAENDKKRFALSEDGLRIRASQGHSVEVDLALTPREPPELLYHGTATRFLDAIRAGGLVPGKRQHVHLSLDVETAIKVGKRHGRPHVLTIRSGDMHRNGVLFFCSANGVWLTEKVAVEYISGL